MGWMQNFLANWSYYLGVVLVELAGGENWSPACGHAGCGQSVGIVVRAIGSR